jgi:hypothetical protein
MTDYLYHALGICGEHSHPHLLNVSLIGMVVYVIYKLMKREAKA